MAENPRIKSGDLWWAAIATSLVPVGLIWDFSWESSVGVDRFWSPPHLAINVGVWLSGLLGGRLIWLFTMARDRDGAVAGISIGRWCGPSGAWVLLWSAALLQVTGVLDYWWQQAYGLGAGLWHPPQILKAAGFFSLLCGGVMLARVGGYNRAWQGGLLLALCGIFLTMTNYPNLQHKASFYTICCTIYPAVVLAVGRAGQGRWGTTEAALLYMALVCVMVWVLPLFPARPLTAPIHNPINRMMPPPFPLLLAVPALVVDWLLGRVKSSSGKAAQSFGVRALLRSHGSPSPLPSPSGRGRMAVSEIANRGWLITALSVAQAGFGFFAVFAPVQWFFARFLLSHSSDNWFFAGGGRHWPYFLKIDQARVMFWGVKEDPMTWGSALLALALAMVSAWLGLRTAAWLRGLRR